MNDISKTIGWADKSWNPITGCSAGCHYCYARKIAMRFYGHFNPTFHPKRLSELSKLKKPKRIFVGSMGDLFDPGVKKEWRREVFGAMARVKRHTYFILTKQPQNIADIDPRYGINLFLGVSVTGPADLWRIAELLKQAENKFTASGRPMSGSRFVSFEPLLTDVGIIPGLDKLELVIIGGQTNPTIIPAKAWVEGIKRQCKAKGVKYFLKGNLFEIPTILLVNRP